MAKEFREGEDFALFAATPPLEALRVIVSEAATLEWDRTGKQVEKVIMINDVARAFFEAPTTRKVCIELPEEDRLPDERDMVGLLSKSLYGTRDAAINFQKEVRKVMGNNGFSNGRYNVSTYYNQTRGLRTMVHGDDFVTVGKLEEVNWLKKQLDARFELKTKIIGKDHESEARVLNRIVRQTPEGWEYEADQRHAETLIKTLNLQDAKSVNTPQEEDQPWKVEEEAVMLDAVKAHEYRSLVARANYLAMDRSDIQNAVKEVCNTMAKPTVGCRRKLKRLARYLLGSPRVVCKYE